MVSTNILTLIDVAGFLIFSALLSSNVLKLIIIYSNSQSAIKLYSKDILASLLTVSTCHAVICIVLRGARFV